MWYLILHLILAVWVFIDAKTRRANALVWAIGTFLLAVVVMPIYFSVRPLKAGETREGGRGWNLLKNFSIVWTLLMAVATTLWGLELISQQSTTSNSEAEQVGFALGTTLGLGMMGAIWFFPVLGALILGLLVKKSSMIEKGPTGTMMDIGGTAETKSDGAVPFGFKKDKKSIVSVVLIIILVILFVYVITSFNDYYFKKKHASGPASVLTSQPISSPQVSEQKEAQTHLSDEEQCKQSFGEAAIQACQKVIEANPDDVEARIKLDWALVNSGQRREAIRKYAEVIKKNPSDATTRLNLCRVYVLMDFNDEAISECQKAIEINPALWRAYSNMGGAYAQKNQHEKAVEFFRKAIELEPNALEAYINIVLSLGALNRFSDARKEIDYMIQQWPADDRVYVSKGIILFQSNRNEEGVAALNKAITINPKQDLAYSMLGGWYSDAGKYEESIENYKKAEAINSNDPEIHKSLGLAYDKFKRKNEALSSFQTYLKFKPNDTEVQKYVASLQSELRTNVPQDQANNQAKEQQISFGTSFQLGDFTYTIKKIQRVARIGNQYFGHKAQEGATLLIVQYDIRNEANETKTVLTDDFTLRDYRGRTYHSSSEANMAYMMSGKKSFLLDEVQPGLKRDMASVFEVPLESASNKGLKLIVPEKGWGTKEMIIDLN